MYKILKKRPNMLRCVNLVKQEQLPDNNEYIVSAHTIDEIFIQRRDIVSFQLDDGRYIKKVKPLTLELLVDHLRGELTLGSYLLNEKSQGRYLVLDADSDPEWRRLQALALALSEKEAISYLENSRRGGHLWLFMVSPMEGKQIQTFGQGLLAYFNIAGIELFPKQDRLSRGPGSLIRLPFGVHRKSGRRYSFYTPQGEFLAPSLRDQIEILSQAETVPEDIFQMFYEKGKEYRLDNREVARRDDATKEGLRGEKVQLSDRIKDAMTVRQFILSYVPLSKEGQGLCPFHDDQVESLSVHDEKNYWNCFGCDTGGSIIDFYMLWQDCDFTTAIRELAKKLL